MRRSARFPEGLVSNGMGPRLLYVLIVGTVILGALALRVWDPTPVARLRSLVFDAYQRLAPRAFDPAAPVRIVDIDERLALADRPMALAAHRAGRARSTNFAGAARQRSRSTSCSPSRTGLSPAQSRCLLRQIPELAALGGEVAQAAIERRRWSAAIGAAPVVIGFIASHGARAIAARAEAGFAIAGDDPRAFVPRFTGALPRASPSCGPAQGVGAVNWLPSAIRSCAACPCCLRRRHALSIARR